jgi:hypothetical protein
MRNNRRRSVFEHSGTDLCRRKSGGALKGGASSFYFCPAQIHPAERALFRYPDGSGILLPSSAAINAQRLAQQQKESLRVDPSTALGMTDKAEGLA